MSHENITTIPRIDAGESVTYDVEVTDDEGLLTVPSDIFLSIESSNNIVLEGNITESDFIPSKADSNGNFIESISKGRFTFTYDTPTGLSEGLYNFVWKGSLQDKPFADLKQPFQVGDPIKAIFPTLNDTALNYMNSLYIYLGDVDKTTYGPETIKNILDQVVSDFNSFAPITSFSLGNFPQTYFQLLMLGGQIFTQIRNGFLRLGKDFQYSDNGISLTFQPGQQMLSGASSLMSQYIQLKEKMKKAIRPRPKGLGSTTIPFGIGRLNELAHPNAGLIFSRRT